MRNLCIYLPILITGSITAQNFITVQPAYTKKTIYKLKEGENIYQKESQLKFSANGTQYLFTTQLNKMFYDISNAGKSKPYKTFIRDEWRDQKKSQSEGYSITLNEETRLHSILNKNGVVVKKDVMATHFHNRSCLNKNLVHGYGFQSTKDSLWYIKGNFESETKGPYKSIQIKTYQKGNIFYKYQTKSQESQATTFVQLNDKTFGPFENAEFLSSHGDGHSFWYRTLKGKKYIQTKNKLIGPISNYRNDYKTKSIIVTYENLEKSYLTYSGEEFPITKKTADFNYNHELKTWVLAEYASYIPKSKGASNIHPVYLYSNAFKDSIGPCNYNSINFHQGYQKENFISYIMPPKYIYDGEKATLNPDALIHIRHIDGKENKPVPNRKAYSFKVLSNDIFYTLKENKENILYKNGVKTEYTHVSPISNGKNYYKKINKEDSTYHLITHSGQEFEIPYNKVNGEIRLLNNTYSIITTAPNYQKEIYIPKTKKQFGPIRNVNYKARLLISDDKLHFANDDYGNILIDNKAFGSGFGLSYNSLMNSYHWYSLEENNVILHSLELD